jgi:hypothetical protein
MTGSFIVPVPAHESTYTDQFMTYVSYILAPSSTNRKLAVPTLEILIKLWEEISLGKLVSSDMNQAKPIFTNVVTKLYVSKEGTKPKITTRFLSRFQKIVQSHPNS